MNTVQVGTLENGPRYLIVSVFLQSDGVTGELNGQVLVDPVSFNLPRTTRFSIYRIDYNFAGFDAILEFDSGAVEPTFRWALSDACNHPADFERWCGGLKDTSGLDGSGKLMISTYDFTSSQDIGSMVIRLRKP